LKLLKKKAGIERFEYLQNVDLERWDSKDGPDEGVSALNTNQSNAQDQVAKAQKYAKTRKNAQRGIFSRDIR
jgi:hypothetical protein